MRWFIVSSKAFQDVVLVLGGEAKEGRRERKKERNIKAHAFI
jgi:hypothetical protein